MTALHHPARGRRAPPRGRTRPAAALPAAWACALALGGALSLAPAHANEPAPDGLPAELDALDLADQAQAKPAATAGSDRWRLFGELAAGRVRDAAAGDATTRRLSLDARHDGRVGADGPRLVLSGRVDVADRDDQRTQDVATLREAYLGWALGDAASLELGRINVRHGAAYGYNPTDFFKGQALRSVTSADPAVLRENRQGTVALQIQRLWASGSVTGLLSPDLGRTPTDDAYSLDLGATNARTRWMFALGQRVNDWLNPQLLLQGGRGQSPQWGLNLAVPLGGAVVGFAEWAAGSGLGVADAALQRSAAKRTRHRAALGLTYTTPFDLSITVEAETNGAGLSATQWQALAPMERGAVLAWADAEQDLPARHALFVHAQWKDVAGSGLDVAGYLRREGTTRSRDQWLELRYGWTHTDLALQWQQYSGAGDSIFGAVPARRTVEVQVRHFF